jgi:hypothetical protein
MKIVIIANLEIAKRMERELHAEYIVSVRSDVWRDGLP